MKKGKRLIKLIPNAVCIIAIGIIGLSYSIGNASIKNYKLASLETSKALQEIKNAYIDANSANTIHVVVMTSKKDNEEKLSHMIAAGYNEKLASIPASVEKTNIRK